MKIIFKDSFVTRFEKHLDFIAENSPYQARKYKNEFISAISKIPDNPYAYRKSFYFDSINIRVLIFKGAVVVFRINKNQIEIFGFIKYQNSL